MQSPAEILEQYWGHGSFRTPQAEIIAAALRGQDVMALLPTGGGKSVCFQVPGMLLPGITLVISPLIALMKDQVEGLNRRGIAAVALHSALSRQQSIEKMEQIAGGSYRFLYLSPERLRSPEFLQYLRSLPVSFIAVDEAHCISQWGYDFRPAYLEIAELRTLFPKAPVMALTASAPPAVQQDIQARLLLRTPAIFRKSFRRENLHYGAARTENIPASLHTLLHQHAGSAIVYARTRKRTVQIAEWLQKAGFAAAAYHGGMSTEARTQVQDAWIAGRLRVMAATNAFGMGIDKPDVRLVVHINLPADPESYYQEAGRGGRDGQESHAVALWSESELVELSRWVEMKFPSWQDLNLHYQALCNFFSIPEGGLPDGVFRFDAQEIATRFDLPLLPFLNSVRTLDREGVLSLQEQPEDYGYLRFTAQPEELLRYKEAFPARAPLLDTLLRSLGGEAWWEEQRISPWRISQKLALGTDELHAQLAHLSQRGLLHYRPPMTEPQIRFLRARLRLTQEELQWDKYVLLKQRATQRLEAMLTWVQNPENNCRSRMLETYFGENTTTDCGHCDTCLHKAHARSQNPEEVLATAFREAVQQQPVPYPELLQRVRIGDMALRQRVLRAMLDKRLLRVDDAGRVCLA